MRSPRGYSQSAKAWLSLASYKQEYALTNSLNIPGVIKAYSIEKHNNTLVIYENFGGESLQLILNKQKLALKDFLKISIKIVDISAQLHSLKRIYKNISPENRVQHNHRGFSLQSFCSTTNLAVWC